MNVLYLSNRTAIDLDFIPHVIRSFGDTVFTLFDRFGEDYIEINSIDFIVSYRYQYLIKEPFLSTFDGRMINCHPSLLPWCRGYFPNAWSFLDDTPKGSTILYIDEGIDTGDIICQKELQFNTSQTLRESYMSCHHAIHDLFEQNWAAIKAGNCDRLPQAGKGTLHYKKEFALIQPHLSEGWDTPIGQFVDSFRRSQVR